MATQARNNPTGPLDLSGMDPVEPAAPQPQTHAQVRSNGLSTFRQLLADASRSSKILLLFTLISIFTQVVVTVTVLALNPPKLSGDSLFRLFLIAYVVRIALSAPIAVVQHLKPPPPRVRAQPVTQGNTTTLTPVAQPDGRAAEEGNATNGAAATPQSQTDDGSNATAGSVWTGARDDRYERARSIVDFLGTVIFVWGNYILIATSPDPVSRPLFALTVAWIVVGYVAVLIPVIVCAAVIFCLPCLLIGMRMLRVGETVGTGAKDDEISNLPVVIFRRQPSATIDALPPSSEQLVDAALRPDARRSSKGPGKRRWWRAWRPFTKKRASLSGGEGASTTSTNNPDEDALYLADEDAVCVICLAEYEDGIELRKLLCGHHFHTGCVDEWLKLNRTCPLCKRDILVNPEASGADANTDVSSSATRPVPNAELPNHVP